MKIIKSIALVLLGVLIIACSQESKLEVNNSGAQKYSIKIGANDMPLIDTKAASTTNSARGGITNVDVSKYDIRYIVAVYNSAGTECIIPPVVATFDKYQEMVYDVLLTPNKTYKFVAWADFVTKGTETDLHYNTSDLTNITCVDGLDKQVNDESRDAFALSKDVTLTNTGGDIRLVLKRPFAKVRVVASDWNKAGGEINEMPDNFKITYYGGKRFNNYNLVTTESANDVMPELATSTVICPANLLGDATNTYYAKGLDETPGTRTLTVDYLMTDKTDLTNFHIKFEALNGVTKIIEHDFKVDIPIKRNYLTTITGNLLTSEAKVNVSIDEYFVDEYSYLNNWFETLGFTAKEPKTHKEADKTVYEIKTREEFMYVSEHPEILGAKTVIRLYNDIDMNGVDWMPIGPRNGGFGGPTGSFEGQNHVLKNFNVANHLWRESKYWGLVIRDWQVGVIGCWYGDIKDVTFENITINGRVGAFGQSHGAWFAGPIAYMYGKLTNVHSKHVFIKATGYYQNLGGLVGYLCEYNGMNIMENCSAIDVDIRGSQAGGLIGSLNTTYTVKNCTSDYIQLRKNGGTGDLRAINGFIGDIAPAGKTITIDKCTAPVHVELVDNSTGEPLKYEPENKYYGVSRKDNMADIVINE